jgi:predicted RNase H-like nuclease
MTLTKPHHVKKVYIGIDLAWGEKNASGFAVLDEDAKLLEYALK